MNKNRLEAFSDGVFSVAATLLVLDIKLGEKDVHSNVQLVALIRESLPNILTFIYSFLVVGIFWVGHLRIFAQVKTLNHYLLWTNIFYLLTVAIIPFAAALISKHPLFPTAIIFYCIVLFICGIQHVILLIYLEHNPNLLEKKALIGASAHFPGPGFLLPTRNADVLRWCLQNGLRIIMPMTLMSKGLYNNPAGAFLPSVLY